MNDILLSFILGIIQGITEFLPISSSAHLLLPSLIYDFKDFGITFDISVHAGTLMAVILYFKDELSKMIKSFFLYDKSLDEHKRMATLLIIATIPIVITGLIFNDIISERIFTKNIIAFSNIIFAALLIIAFKLGKKTKSIISITILGAIFIGIFQVFSVIPGASRSGVAITGALFLGLTLKQASKFSFLLSIPTITGALILMLAKIGGGIIEIDLLYMLIGFLTSMTFSFFTIKYFLIFVERIGMTPFVLYRLLLGIVLLLI
tara:strand:+ start:401 stop:1189 length:789 start_codon:yes stop_codon:yes gene_type:complete